MKKPLGPVKKTSRGFEIIEFKDRYEQKCSLQASSLADYEQAGVSAVWFGPENAEPRILASRAHEFGIVTTETCGWIPYPIPDGVMLSTRAHLDREQVSSLILHLQSWLDKGRFRL